MIKYQLLYIIMYTVYTYMIINCQVNFSAFQMKTKFHQLFLKSSCTINIKSLALKSRIPKARHTNQPP